MATNLRTFTAEVLAAPELLKREVIVLHRRMVASFVEIVAIMMPVDTGHALANITVSLRSPDPTENFDEPISVGEVVRRARSRMRVLRAFDIVYVNFNAPYVSFLNEGSSAQAPAGFIDAAEALVEAQFAVFQLARAA